MSARDLTESEILEHLKKNTIGRNQQLSVMTQLINSASDNTFLAIDGAWGSGKTVFVKQLVMLGDDDQEMANIKDIDASTIEQLRKTHAVIYFNAWENDYFNDPLGSLLLALIAQASGDRWMQAEGFKRAVRTIDIPELIKTLTKGGVNLSAKSTEQKLTASVEEIFDRKQLVHQLLSEIITNGYKDKSRILFVVDELDRCKPSFAVELLEVIKHYYTRNDTTFVFATNLQQLAHTVQKFYGYNFDGFSYLNKFFDFSYHLKTPNTELYTRQTLDWNFKGGMVDGVVSDAIKYFGFQMREINSYISAIRLIEGYLSSSRLYFGNHEDEAFVKWLLTPFAIALKVKNDSGFHELVSGTKKGEQILRDFLAQSSEMQDFSRKLTINNVDIDASEAELEKLHREELIKIYQQLFVRETGQSITGVHLDAFQNAVSLLSDYTIIKEDTAEDAK